MDEEVRQEEIAAMVGTLSAVDQQLQQVEETALRRASVFLEEAKQTETPTNPQFNTMGYLLQEICADVHEIREYLDRLEGFLREGKYEDFDEEVDASERESSYPLGRSS
ncbi:MAG: hypothetical protein ACLFTE_09940 [Salinivenus sp.]